MPFLENSTALNLTGSFMSINTLRATVLAASFAMLPLSVLAQSSVSIYGRVNTTLESQKSDGERQTVISNNSSRFGFTGTEDLGGGLKAMFKLESGFDSSTGVQTDTAYWGREATVGLSGGFGTVRLGRMAYLPAYLATADYVSMHNHDTGSSSDALFGGFQLPARQTNSVSYTTPSFGGLTVEIAQSLTEDVPGLSTQTDLALNYDNGPLHLGAGYQKLGNDKLLAVRALYELGAWTVGGYYERDDFESQGDRNNARIAVMYTLGASEIHVNVGSAGAFSNIADSKAQQYTLGYNYNLSKRTKVYGYVTRINDSAAGVYGGDFNATAVGVRHNF